jgi:predicted dehydrogenase
MKLRAAIAGAGLMGFWHARSIARVGGEVAAVCDVDVGAARRLARRFRNARAGANLEAVLKAGDKIDILHICTPSATHFELASAALTRGIHVLVEKPMTPARTETERLYELAAEHRVLLSPVHQFPFQPGVQRALTEFGRIEQLRHFEATFCSAGGAGRSPEELDTIVTEILPHPLSLMQLFAPGSLSEKSWSVSRPALGEFRATLTSGGICFSILISMNSRPTTTNVRLLGTAGTIHVDLFHGFCAIEPGQVSRWRKIIHPFDLATRIFLAAGSNLATRAWIGESAYPGLRALIDRFYAACSTDSEPPIKREEAIEVAFVCDRLGNAGTAVSLSTRRP